MLKRLIDHQQVVKSVFIHKFPSISSKQKAALSKVNLDHESWDILQALTDVLAPLELATRTLSGKHYPTLALVHTTMDILRYGLRQKDTDSLPLTLFKKSLLAQFELYLDLQMTSKQKELILVRSKKCVSVFSTTSIQVASFLDPDSHRQLNREDLQAAKRILPILMKKESQPIVSPPFCSPASSVRSSQVLTDKLKIMVGMSTSTKQSRPLAIDEELVLFSQSIQSFNGDFSSFWINHRARFSRLYRVAQRINIIAATSVPSESIFSIAGFIARKQRTSLSSSSLRYLMVLKESHRLDGLRTKSSSQMI
jgi:hypothetical protein